MKKTFLQIAGILGVVAVLVSTLNTDALASRRHHHRHHGHSHYHGHRR
ncbi:MAG: hypothetical protein NT163_08965 [Chlorobiales bacterium]|jgi:hypothetical protein|nr:hypothetical protein [Chlorobiales bacterium]